MTYLEDHPPAASQYHKPRRATPTGAIVLHDAENATDLDGPDTGAEAVARFIAGRTDPGSYHSIVDSDSTVRLVPYEWEAFHEGTGGNRWSLGLSFAYGSARPPTDAWWAAALPRGATEARAMAAWVKATTGITVPAKRITAADYRAGRPGFVPHADLDPARRSDPVGFRWDQFIALYADSTPEGPTMPPTIADLGAAMATIQQLYINRRGSVMSLEERISWGRDVETKLAAGADLKPTYDYIAWALDQGA
jgi:hypothetical protein